MPWPKRARLRASSASVSGWRVCHTSDAALRALRRSASCATAVSFSRAPSTRSVCRSRSCRGAKRRASSTSASPMRSVTSTGGASSSTSAEVARSAFSARSSRVIARTASRWAASPGRSASSRAVWSHPRRCARQSSPRRANWSPSSIDTGEDASTTPSARAAPSARSRRSWRPSAGPTARSRVAVSTS